MVTMPNRQLDELRNRAHGLSVDCRAKVANSEALIMQASILMEDLAVILDGFEQRLDLLEKKSLRPK